MNSNKQKGERKIMADHQVVEYFMDPLPKGPAALDISFIPGSYTRNLPFFPQNLGTFSMGERYFTRRSGMDSYLLLVTIEGCGQVTAADLTHSLGEGTAVLIDCNRFHEYRTAPGCHWLFHYLHFGALSMEGYRSILLDRLTVIPLRSLNRVENMMQELSRLSEQNSVAADILLSHQISALLTELILSLNDAPESAPGWNRPEILQLAAFIRKNFAEDLHIEDFMKLTRLSRHYLIHLFKQQIGMAPYHYLHMCRINYAQHLLKTTEASVAEIGFSVGYANAAVFIRHFKSFLGITPGEFRSRSLRLIDAESNFGQ